MDFTSYFEEVRKQNRKFVLIIGSRFHPDILEDSCLNSWENLMKIIDLSYQFIPGKNNFLIDCERMIMRETGLQDEKHASKIEQNLLAKISNQIKCEQQNVCSTKMQNYPLEIFNSRYISDVISLNFDLVPEIMLNEGKSPKVKYLYSKSEKRKKLSSTRHRIINGINFWHPHGDVGNADTLILSVRKYCNNIIEIEKLRKRFKQNEKTVDYIESWFDKLVLNPIIVVGASLSETEWDLWSALINRERNFAKGKNIQFKNLMFQMRSKEVGNTVNSFFHPLFPTEIPFAEQWKMLRKIFGQ